MNNKFFTLVSFLLLSLSVLQTVSANTDFDLNNYKGRVVYVDFWASWCAPCRASFPFMYEMADEYSDSLVIVAINVDKSRQDADEFLGQFEVNFDIVYDPEGSLAKSFDVKGMPTSFIYGRDGQLIDTHIGFKKKDVGKLESAIREAIDSQE